MTEERKIHEIPVSKIIVSDRQRQDLGDVISLQLSIDRLGLQYPIIVQPGTDNTYVLIAGGRRLQAYKNLEKDTIPALFKEDLDEVQRYEIELEENIQRKQLTHLEEAKAIAALDKLKRQRYGSALPGRFSSGTGWSQADTAKSLGLSAGKISQDISIAEMVEKFPELAKIPTRREVLREIRRIEDGTYQKEIPEVELKFKESFIQEDAQERLFKVDPGSIDLALLNYTPGQDDLVKRLPGHLKATGMGYIFFSVNYYVLVHKLLRDSGFRTEDKFYIWHIKGKDDYVPFLWFSQYLQAPPKNLALHNSYSLDKNNKHSEAKSYEFLFPLVTLSSPKAGFILDFHSYSPALFRVGLDTGRNTLSLCPNKTIYDSILEDFNA